MTDTLYVQLNDYNILAVKVYRSYSRAEQDHSDLYMIENAPEITKFLKDNHAI